MPSSLWQPNGPFLSVREKDRISYKELKDPAVCIDLTMVNSSIPAPPCTLYELEIEILSTGFPLQHSVHRLLESIKIVQRGCAM